MTAIWPGGLLFLLIAPSLAFAQESLNATSQSGPSPLKVRLAKPPIWKQSCLELTLSRVNHSKFPIFLPPSPFEGIEIYSSVSDATNTLGQGSGEAWMLVYGWTDVFASKSIELAPGARKQNTLCIEETFPVKETGKETLRQVRVQGKLRIVAGYETPAWKIIDQSQGKGKRAYVRTFDKSDRWTFGEVVLEVPIPCRNGIETSECVSAPQIFPHEHDVYTIELEPPPAIELQPPPLPILSVDRPPPPKP